MSADFDFAGGAYTPPAGGAVDFEFGAPAPTFDEITIAATLPLPDVAVVVDGLREVTVAGALPPPVVSVAIESGVALIFSKPASSSTDLVFQFGDGDTIPRVGITVEATLPLPTLQAAFIPPVHIEVDGMLPGPTLAAHMRPVTRVAVSFAIPGPVVSSEIEYLSNTQRPTVAATQVEFQQAEPLSAGVAGELSDGQRASVGWVAHLQKASGLMHWVEHHLPGQLRPDRHASTTGLQDGQSLGLGQEAALQDARRAVRRLLATAFENAAFERAATSFGLQDGDRSKRATRSAQMQEARHVRVRHSSGVERAAHLNLYWQSAFQDGVPPPAGVSTPPVAPVQPGGCYSPSAHLLFSFPAVIGGDLLFQCGDYSPPTQSGIVVPVRRFYMVVNSVSLFAMPSGVELSALTFGMTLDADSWTWSVQATLDKAAEPHVRRGAGDPPVELQAFVNGVPYRFMVDSVGRSKQFPVERVQIKGRGLAAELADPWCPQLSFGNLVDRTAQQLMSDVLTSNGVPIGWSVDWGIDDWLVTGGAWQFQGTYIDAVKDIAESVGAYVQPHATGRTLRVMPRYPAAPWDWGDLTPDIVLPAAAVQVDDTQWINKPEYNGVWVGGISAGVFGPVIRNGTSGSLLAPQVRHALITDHVAHRQRGVAVLSDTGRQAEVQLTLQVLPETGIIPPGLMVEYVVDDGPVLGIVRSTSVNWARPKLRQTIALETHDA